MARHKYTTSAPLTITGPDIVRIVFAYLLNHMAQTERI